MINNSVIQMICDLIPVALYLHWYIARKSRCRSHTPTPPRNVQLLPQTTVPLAKIFENEYQDIHELHFVRG